MSELVHVFQDGQTGGWHACTDAEWMELRRAAVRRPTYSPSDISWERVPAYRVTLGRLFIDDHESRALPFGIVVDENKRTYTLLMTVGDIREVYSDANHYADSMGEWDDAYGRSVRQAAGRVAEALQKQVPDQLR